MSYKKIAKSILKKLNSRKFWTMLASFVVSVLALFNFDENTLLQVTSLITTFGTAVVYIIGESMVDSAGVGKEENNESEK